jgi:hypothetical protein
VWISRCSSRSALLIARLLVELGMRRAAAYTAVLLWAVHPLRVESVAWLTSRKDVQSLLFRSAVRVSRRIRGGVSHRCCLFVTRCCRSPWSARVRVDALAIVWLRSRRKWAASWSCSAVADLAVARWGG